MAILNAPASTIIVQRQCLATWRAIRRQTRLIWFRSPTIHQTQPSLKHDKTERWSKLHQPTADTDLWKEQWLPANIMAQHSSLPTTTHIVVAKWPTMAAATRSSTSLSIDFWPLKTRRTPSSVSILSDRYMSLARPLNFWQDTWRCLTLL